jgi:hypothetical protein
MRDFADSGAASVFNVHLLQGVARVITGKIVEQNPRGFAVSTPEGTIGIRGTIISLRTGDGTTTVYVENTTRAVYVNNINVPGGQKITLPADPIRPEPIVPQDRRNLGRDLAFRGGMGVAAAAPEPVMDSGRPEEQLRGSTHLVAQAGLIPPETSLAEVSLPVQSLGDSLAAVAVTAPTPMIATVSGTTLSSLMGYSGNSFSGSFSFSANLSTGTISGAAIAGSGIIASSTPFTVNYYNGSGTMISLPFPVFEIHNFSAGSGTTPIFATPTGLANSVLKGGVDLAAIPNGGSLLVDYLFVDGSMMALDAGQGTGTLTK